MVVSGGGGADGPGVSGGGGADGPGVSGGGGAENDESGARLCASRFLTWL